MLFVLMWLQMLEMLAIGSAQDAICAMEYAGPCPEGWPLSKEHNKCVKPSDYKGCCNDITEISAYDQKKKQAWEIYCGAYWPTQHCPVNWTYIPHVTQGTCKKPSTCEYE